LLSSIRRELPFVARAREGWGKGDYKYNSPSAEKNQGEAQAGGQKEKGDILCQVFLKIQLVAL
jgi:hypothetical protein